MNNTLNDIFRAKTIPWRVLLSAVLVLPALGAAFGLPNADTPPSRPSNFRQLAQVPYQGSAELLQQINKTVVAEMRGDYATVASLLPAAIYSAQLELGRNHALTALLINKLGKAYKETGRFPEAESAYRKALQARVAGLGYDHPDVAETMNHMGVLYELLDRMPESLQLHSDALSIRRGSGNLPHWIVAQSLHNLGSVLARMNRLQEAEAHLLESLHLTSIGEGRNDLKVKISTLEHLIVLYTRQGRYDEGDVLKASLQRIHADRDQTAGRQRQADATQPTARQPTAQQHLTSTAQPPQPLPVSDTLPPVDGDPLAAARRLLMDAQQRLASLSARPRPATPQASRGKHTGPAQHTGNVGYLVTVDAITSEAESRAMVKRLLESGISATSESDARKPRFWRLVLGKFRSHQVAIGIAVEATRVIGRTAAIETKEASPADK